MLYTREGRKRGRGGLRIMILVKYKWKVNKISTNLDTMFDVSLHVLNEPVSLLPPI